MFGSCRTAPNQAGDPDPAILRAQEELRSTRKQLDEARRALLEAASKGDRPPFVTWFKRCRKD